MNIQKRKKVVYYIILKVLEPLQLWWIIVWVIKISVYRVDFKMTIFVLFFTLSGEFFNNWYIYRTFMKILLFQIRLIQGHFLKLSIILIFKLIETSNFDITMFFNSKVGLVYQIKALISAQVCNFVYLYTLYSFKLCFQCIICDCYKKLLYYFLIEPSILAKRKLIFPRKVSWV